MFFFRVFPLYEYLCDFSARYEVVNITHIFRPKALSNRYNDGKYTENKKQPPYLSDAYTLQDNTKVCYDPGIIEQSSFTHDMKTKRLKLRHKNVSFNSTYNYL